MGTVVGQERQVRSLLRRPARDRRRLSDPGVAPQGRHVPALEPVREECRDQAHRTGRDVSAPPAALRGAGRMKQITIRVADEDLMEVVGLLQAYDMRITQVASTTTL